MCGTLRWPCLCDSLSLLHPAQPPTSPGPGPEPGPTRVLFFCADRLFNSQLFCEALGASVRVVIRVGGSMIRAKIHDWLSGSTATSNNEGADDGALRDHVGVVRVHDHVHGATRADPSLLADEYMHVSMGAFARSVGHALGKDAASNSSGDGATLRVMRLADTAHRKCLKETLPSRRTTDTHDGGTEVADKEADEEAGRAVFTETTAAAVLQDRPREQQRRRDILLPPRRHGRLLLPVLGYAA